MRRALTIAGVHDETGRVLWQLFDWNIMEFVGYPVHSRTEIEAMLEEEMALEGLRKPEETCGRGCSYFIPSIQEDGTERGLCAFGRSLKSVQVGAECSFNGKEKTA